MQCKEVDVVLEQEGCLPVPEAARAHLAGCNSCRNLIADLTAIIATAHLLPAEVEPPPRVWTSLRVQLEQEGIIRSGARQSWLSSFSELFRPRVLATSPDGLLILAAVPLQFESPATQAPGDRRAHPDAY